MSNLICIHSYHCLLEMCVWSPPSPSQGMLAVRMGPDENNLKEIMSVPDTDAGPTKQKLYTVNVPIPAM